MRYQKVSGKLPHFDHIEDNYTIKHKLLIGKLLITKVSICAKLSRLPLIINNFLIETLHIKYHICFSLSFAYSNNMTIYSRNSIQSKTFNIITVFFFFTFWHTRSCPILMLPMPIQNVCHVTHNNARIKNGFKRCKKMARHVCML